MKKITVEYEEIIRRNNTIAIEVEDDFDEDIMFDELEYEIRKFDHPDDIIYKAREFGKIVKLQEGAESCEYELN